MRKKEILHKLYMMSVIVLLAVTAMQNLLAWLSHDYADWHRVHVFPFFQKFMTSVSNMFTFSLGEILLAIALVFAVLFLIVTISFAVFKIVKKDSGFFAGFYKISVLLVAVVAFIMTNNCFILYHSDGLEGSYLIGASDNDYDFIMLANSREYVVKKANELAKQIERDENGNPVFRGNLAEESIRAMQKLGEDWNELSGYYSVPKPLLASDFMCQQSMRGYYFPFTMEANYNTEMTTVNMPSTMCHELAHTKGFIKEDEANFIAYMACINSDNKFFQYSGYLSVLNYIDNDFREACADNKGLYSGYTRVSGKVKSDNVFILEEVETKIEKTAIIPTKTVKAAAKSYVDFTLAANGIPEGSVSYCKVVGLLIYSLETETTQMLAQAN